MKTEEGAGEKKPGDTSEPAAQPEPTSETLQNFSRVTPAQIVHIAFPSNARYQPVRVVSSQPAPSRRSAKAVLSAEKYAGGGGILLLIDQRPSEAPDYIEFTTATVVAPEAEVPPPQSRHIALDPSAEEVGPPESFEVRASMVVCQLATDELDSTLLITTRSRLYVR